MIADFTAIVLAALFILLFAWVIGLMLENRDLRQQLDSVLAEADSRWDDDEDLFV